MRLGHAIAAIGLAGCVVLTARTAAADPPETPAQFVARLRQAVDARDRRAVADMFSYPPTVVVAGFRIGIPDPAKLVELYDSLFASNVRCMIDRAMPGRVGSAGGYSEAGPDGVSIGGIIWAKRTGPRFRIWRMILSTPGAPERRTSRAPQRIAFTDPRYPAQAAGTLAGDGVDSYLLSVRPGQRVTVQIDGFRGRDAVLRVAVAAGSRAAAGADAAPSPRRWVHQASEAATYRLEVVRLAPFCDPPFAYTLTVRIE